VVIAIARSLALIQGKGKYLGVIRKYKRLPIKGIHTGWKI